MKLIDSPIEIFYSPTKNVTWYNFTITDYAGNRSPCEIILDLPLGEDPETQSWYDIQCTNSPWFISWGYYPAGDAAVLTVVRYVTRSSTTGYNQGEGKSSES